MYRQYEDPYKLEQELQLVRDSIEYAKDRGADPEDMDWLYIEAAELEERVNFAWQDDEFYHDCRDWEDELWMYENCYEEV